MIISFTGWFLLFWLLFLNAGLAYGGTIVITQPIHTDYKARIKQTLLNGRADKPCLLLIIDDTLFQEGKWDVTVFVDFSPYEPQVASKVEGRYSNDDQDTMNEASFQQEVEERLNLKALVGGIEEVFNEFSGFVEQNKQVCQDTEEASDADSPESSSSDNDGATGNDNQREVENIDSNQVQGGSEQQSTAGEVTHFHSPPNDSLREQGVVRRYERGIKGYFNDPQEKTNFIIYFYNHKKEAGVYVELACEKALYFLKVCNKNFNLDRFKVDVIAPFDWTNPAWLADCLALVCYVDSCAYHERCFYEYANGFEQLNIMREFLPEYLESACSWDIFPVQNQLDMLLIAEYLLNTEIDACNVVVDLLVDRVIHSFEFIDDLSSSEANNIYSYLLWFSNLGLKEDVFQKQSDIIKLKIKHQNQYGDNVLSRHESFIYLAIATIIIGVVYFSYSVFSFNL